MVTQSISKIDDFSATEKAATVWARALSEFSTRFAAWREQRAQRRAERDAVAALRGMSDHCLKDIGLNRSTIASTVRERNGKA